MAKRSILIVHSGRPGAVDTQIAERISRSFAPLLDVVELRTLADIAVGDERKSALDRVLMQPNLVILLLSVNLLDRIGFDDLHDGITQRDVEGKKTAVYVVEPLVEPWLVPFAELADRGCSRLVNFVEELAADEQLNVNDAARRVFEAHWTRSRIASAPRRWVLAALLLAPGLGAVVFAQFLEMEPPSPPVVDEPVIVVCVEESGCDAAQSLISPDLGAAILPVSREQLDAAEGDFSMFARYDERQQVIVLLDGEQAEIFPPARLWERFEFGVRPMAPIGPLEYVGEGFVPDHESEHRSHVTPVELRDMLRLLQQIVDPEARAKGVGKFAPSLDEAMDPGARMVFVALLSLVDRAPDEPECRSAKEALACEPKSSPGTWMAWMCGFSCLVQLPASSVIEAAQDYAVAELRGDAHATVKRDTLETEARGSQEREHFAAIANELLDALEKSNFDATDHFGVVWDEAARYYCHAALAQLEDGKRGIVPRELRNWAELALLAREAIDDGGARRHCRAGRDTDADLADALEDIVSSTTGLERLDTAVLLWLWRPTSTSEALLRAAYSDLRDTEVSTYFAESSATTPRTVAALERLCCSHVPATCEDKVAPGCVCELPALPKTAAREASWECVLSGSPTSNR